MSRAQRRGAFTLLEVLIVIAVIALLVGIALPLLGRARAQARLTRCGANLRQIGAGLMGYAADNRDTLPTNYETTWTMAWVGSSSIQMAGITPSSWVEALQESMGVREPPWLRPLRCPAALDNYPGLDAGGSPEMAVPSDAAGSAWILNSYCAGRMVGSIPRPADGALAFETGLWSQMCGVTGQLELANQPYCYPHPTVNPQWSPAAWNWAYRGLRRNILWCDGHVAAFEARHWREGHESYDGERIRHMRFGLAGKNLFDP